MNLLKRCASAIVGAAFVFGTLYVGARFEIPWIAGFLLLGVAYLAGIEYLQLTKKLGIELPPAEKAGPPLD